MRGFYNTVVKANNAQFNEMECKDIEKIRKDERFYTVVFFGPKDHPFYEGIYKPFYNFLEPASYNTGGASRFFVLHNSDPNCA